MPNALRDPHSAVAPCDAVRPPQDATDVGARSGDGDGDGLERLSGLTLVVTDAPDERGPRTPRLALGQPTTRRWTLEEDLAAVAPAGLDAVGLWNGKFRGRTRRDVTEAVLQSGVAVTSLSWVGGFTHGDQFERKQAWFEAKEAVMLAAAVGARCVCVAPGGAGGFTEKHARGSLIPESLRRLAAFAAEFEVRLAVQPLSGKLARNSVVRDVHGTLELLDRVGRSNVGMVLSTTLMARDASLVNRVEEFAHRVELVKLADCRTDDPRCDVCCDGRMPGDGSLPLATLIRRLERAGYAGDYELDVWNRVSWQTADHAADLRRARARFDDYLAGPADGSAGA